MKICIDASTDDDVHRVITRLPESPGEPIEAWFANAQGLWGTKNKASRRPSLYFNLHNILDGATRLYAVDLPPYAGLTAEEKRDIMGVNEGREFNPKFKIT